MKEMFEVGDIVEFKCTDYNGCRNGSRRLACKIGIFSEIRGFSYESDKADLKDTTCYAFKHELNKATDREEFLYRMYGSKFLEVINED